MWESSRDGPKEANVLGCITQVGSLSRRHGFPAFTSLAIGGWDVVATPLGEALYNARILDYDLVRQVREEMNAFPVMRGVFDPDFVGQSQHEGATFTAAVDATRAEQLEILREDIRRFKQEEGVGGHCTVVWSASVERPADEYGSADALLAAIERDERELSPSLLYATAAVLEGCSFVNGGSQNTVQPGLLELAGRSASPLYVLGTDFKAGQTKCKTAIVEYLRALALRPRTIASYNHLVRPALLPRSRTCARPATSDPAPPTPTAGQQRHEEPSLAAYVEGEGACEDGRLWRLGRRWRNRPQGGGSIHGADG